MIAKKKWLCTVFRATEKIQDWYLDCLLLFPLGFFVASQIIIPLPFSVVPLSLQPLPVLLAAWFFGKRGIAGYAIYLLEGAAGLPIFSGFSGGVLHLLGPTGGYLTGFLLGGIVIAVARIYQHKALAAYGWYVCAMGIVFLCGIAQLSAFIPVKMAVLQGLLPFIIGDFMLKPLVFVGAVCGIQQWRVR